MSSQLKINAQSLLWLCALACRKSMFYKKCLSSIPIPFRTLCWLCFVQSLVCPYFGILAENPFPRGEGLCMLCWLCIVHSLAAYTPGIRAGAILLGLPPLDPARMHAVSRTKPLHDVVAQMADDLYGGLRPKARTLWLLAKSFARCKTNKASNARHPIIK